MDLRRLEYFVALARERHFTKAAERASVSQPNLSKQIRELERELGVTLIDRLGHQVHLTPAGEDLLRHAEALLAEADQMQALMSEHRGQTRGRLVVGVMNTPSVYLLPQAAARFKCALPCVDLVLQTHHTPDIYQGLRGNALQLGVAFLPADEPLLEAEPLFEEELVLAVPREHPLAKRGAMAVAELAEWPLTLPHDLSCRRLIDRASVQAGVRLRPTLEMSSIEGIRATVEHGLGAAILPWTYVRRVGDASRLAVVRLTDPTPRECLALLTHRQRRPCSATRAMMDALREEVARLLDAPAP